VARFEPVEGGDEVAELVLRVAGLAQLVAARIAQWRDALPDAGIGVVPQPLRRLHDVGVGVVDHQSRRVVRHRESVPAPEIWARFFAADLGAVLLDC
jgi:hypothetical protein